MLLGCPVDINVTVCIFRSYVKCVEGYIFIQNEWSLFYLCIALGSTFHGPSCLSVIGSLSLRCPIRAKPLCVGMQTGDRQNVSRHAVVVKNAIALCFKVGIIIVFIIASE